MKESTRLAIARLEAIIAENAGNRLTYALMRGMHQQMTEMLVQTLEADREPDIAFSDASGPAVQGAQLVAAGKHRVGGDAG